MNKLLKIVALLGIAGVAYAGPSQPPAGNYLVNASTIPSRPALKVSSATVSDLTPGICVEAGSGGKLVSAVSGLACGSGGGSGGSSSLETMVNGVRISSPTGSQNFVQGGGISITGSVPAGTTAQITIKTVLPSSGIAFGSASNTVTSDTNTVTWDNVNKSMLITTKPNLTALALQTTGNDGVSQFLYNNTQSQYLQNYMVGSGGDVFTGAVAGDSIVRSGGSLYLVGGGITSGSALKITPSTAEFPQTVTFDQLTALRFMKTDGSKNAISYDLLNATQSWTGGNTFSSMTVLNITPGSLVKGDSTSHLAPATSADVIAAFSGCSGTQYLGADGACHAAASGSASTLAVFGSTGTDTVTIVNVSSPTPALLADTTNMVLTAAVPVPGGGTATRIVLNPNLTVSTLTISGGQNTQITEPNGVSGQIMLSTTTPTYGQLPIISSSMTITATPLTNALLAVNSSSVLVSTTVDLGAANVGGNLPVARLNSGTNADSSHFWRGDGTWVSSGTFSGSGTPNGGNFNVQVSSAGAFAGVAQFNVYPSSIVVGNQFITSLSSTVVDSSFTATNVNAMTFTGPGGFTNTYGIVTSTIQVSSNTILGAATYYANGVVAGASMNANELSGTLQAGQFPALTGDITTAAGALATTAAAQQNNIVTLAASSVTIAGTAQHDGLTVYLSSTVNINAAGTRMTPVSTNIKIAPVNLAVATALTGLPTISTATVLGGQTAYADGTYIIVSGTSAVTTIKLQDNGTLSGSRLYLNGSAYVTVSSTQSVSFSYNSSNNGWNLLSTH